MGFELCALRFAFDSLTALAWSDLPPQRKRSLPSSNHHPLRRRAQSKQPPATHSQQHHHQIPLPRRHPINSISLSVAAHASFCLSLCTVRTLHLLFAE